MDGNFALRPLEHLEGVSGVERLAVASSTLVAVVRREGDALSRCLVGTWRDGRPMGPLADMIDIELPGHVGRSRVSALFMDPSGSHVIISLSGGATLYLPCALGMAAVPLGKERLRGHAVTAVAWNARRGTGDATAPFLLGTEDGLLFECEINASVALKKKEVADSCISQVYELPAWPPAPGGVRDPVRGLLFDELAAGNFAVLTCVVGEGRPLRYSQFVGGPDFGALFAHPRYTQQQAPVQIVPPSAEACGSELCCWRSWSSVESASPTPPVARAFALLTGPGVCVGELDSRADLVPGDLFARKVRVLPFSEAEQAGGLPICVARTEFHLILLFGAFVQIKSTLTGLIVARLPLFSAALGLAVEPRTQRTLVYTSGGVWSLDVRDPYRGVWRIFLERGELARAMKYAPSGSTAREEVVLALAGDLVQKHQYVKAAKLYAQLPTALVRFEEVALRFLEEEQPEALEAYLASTLQRLQRQAEAAAASASAAGDGGATQRMLVSSWLTELRLFRLSRPAAQDDGVEMKKQFRKFLRETDADRHNETTEQLIGSYGSVRDPELNIVAEQSGEYAHVVQKHMQRGEWKAAVQVLERLPHAQLGLVYRYSSVLMRQLPDDVVRVWMRMGTKLNPSKLVPALAQYSARPKQRVMVRPRSRARGGRGSLDAGLGLGGGGAEGGHGSGGGGGGGGLGGSNRDGDCALMYLRFCVESGFGDRSIHNFLVALLARKGVGEEEQLLAYLESYGASLEECGGNEAAQLEQCKYDPHYALRCCLDGEKAHSATLIYQKLGRTEDAVRHALSNDLLILAKKCCVKSLKLLSLLVSSASTSSSSGAGGDRADGSAGCKALWMQLAEYCCRKAGEQGGGGLEQDLRQKSVDQIESILQDSDGLVQIEDLLLLLPDTLSLSRFKQQIEVSFERCVSFLFLLSLSLLRHAHSSYSLHCRRYHRNMDESKQQLLDLKAVQQRVHSDLQYAKLEGPLESGGSSGEGAKREDQGASRVIAVTNDRLCDLSGRPLLASQRGDGGARQLGTGGASGKGRLQCHVFPCQHCFRTDALVAYVGALLPPQRRGRISELLSSIASMSGGDVSTQTPAQLADVAALRLKLDEEIASQCPLCGDLAVQALTTPFVSAQSLAAWEL